MISVNRYRACLDAGFRRPVRYRLGDAPNEWGGVVHSCADRLAAMDLPPEVVAVLDELFTEVGQQARDAWSIGDPSLNLRLT